MKTVFPHIAVLCGLFSLTPLQAYDPDPEPEVAAKQAGEMAKALGEEAKMWESKAAEETGDIARDLKKLAKLTADEAEEVGKAAEAWGNRQVRLAKRYQKKAWEICEERGKLLEKVKGVLDKPGKYPPKEHPMPPKDGKPMPPPDKSGKEIPPPKKDADPASGAESLRQQIERLGE